MNFSGGPCIRLIWLNNYLAETSGGPYEFAAPIYEAPQSACFMWATWLLVRIWHLYELLFDAPCVVLEGSWAISDGPLRQAGMRHI